MRVMSPAPLVWLSDHKYSLLERLACRMFQQGAHLPKHVAFIMDGNRRFARLRNEQTILGHTKGFDTLNYALDWCHRLAITQVTVFAFSIENFKRTQSEVDGLMQFAIAQFQLVINRLSEFEKQGVCVRVYGRLALLPVKLQKAIARVVLHTCGHTNSYLNLCIAYTATDEIATAMDDLRECVLHGLIYPDDITETTLSRAMYSLGLPEPDILLRTSGEIRLSDFLLWQSAFSHISFVRQLWPQMSIWTLFRIILQYNRQVSLIEQSKINCQKLHSADTYRFSKEQNGRIEQCCQYIRDKRMNQMKNILSLE